MYLRGLAGETADNVLDGLRQVATLLPHTYQEVMQLLIPATQISHVFILQLHTSITSSCMCMMIFGMLGLVDYLLG